MPPEGRYFKFVMPLALELGENSLGREQFGGNHKVNLEKNAGKPTVLNWARWLPVVGVPRCYLPLSIVRSNVGTVNE